MTHQSARHETLADPVLCREGGFTLLEITIALIIVTIFLSGAILGSAQFMNRYRVIETQNKIKKIENSLAIYAQRNYRLPCPADPQTLSGLEINATTSRFGKCFNTGSGNKFADATGVVPWRELGLRQEDVIDAWGNFYTYKPSPHLTLDMTSDEMLDAPDSDDNTATLLDVHDTCRSTQWFDDNTEHVNRAKAMFCCNAAPKVPYLAVGSNQTGGSVDISNWNMMTVASSQQVGALTNVEDFGDLPVSIVADTNAWLQSMEHSNYGDFEFPHNVVDNRKDVPLGRASGIAFSIVSHGPNGKLAFIPGAPRTTRKLGSFNARGQLLTNVGRASELEVFNTLQISAGSTYNPKLADTKGLVNKTGLKENSSDDVTSYVRSDQLMTMIGTSSCLRTGNMEPMRPERTDQKIVNPNRCFRKTRVAFSVQSTLAACNNARAQLEACPSSELTPTLPAGSVVDRNYLQIALVANRPVDNSDELATYRCAIGSVWGNAAGTAGYGGSGACYVVGYKYKQLLTDCP